MAAPERVPAGASTAPAIEAAPPEARAGASHDGSALRRARVVLEATPPLQRHRDKALALLENGLRAYTRFDALGVPDIQDGGEFGRSVQRVDGLAFARWLREQVDRPLSLYKVTMSVTAPELEAWLDAAEELGVRDVVLVGGDSSAKRYPEGVLSVGPAAKIARRRGMSCGGVIIPTRRREFASRPASRDELGRIQDKIHNWDMEFYTTQLLYEGEWMACLLLDMVRSLPIDRFPKVFLTFSPFVCEEDLDFAMRALGVYVPSDVERTLRGARNMVEASIGQLTLVWERLSTFASEIGIPADRLGVNVEYLNSRNPRNVRAALELAEEFGRLLGVRG